MAGLLPLDNTGDRRMIVKENSYSDGEVLSEESQAIRLISAQGFLGPEAPG